MQHAAGIFPAAPPLQPAFHSPSPIGSPTLYRRLLTPTSAYFPFCLQARNGHSLVSTFARFCVFANAPLGGSDHFLSPAGAATLLSACSRSCFSDPRVFSFEERSVGRADAAAAAAAVGLVGQVRSQPGPDRQIIPALQDECYISPVLRKPRK